MFDVGVLDAAEELSNSVEALHCMSIGGVVAPWSMAPSPCYHTPQFSSPCKLEVVEHVDHIGTAIERVEGPQADTQA